MKIMIREKQGRGFEAYVPKKDLEEPIVEMEKPGLWGGWVKLANGWIFDLPAMETAPKLPVTVEARKRGED
jgi:nitrogen fixation protein NifT